MENIFEAIFFAVLYLVSFAVYAKLIAGFLPKKLLPVIYDTQDHLGRGLKKMTYPEGRAVLYEPHPSIRKYIRQYLLFTADGYKYLQSQVGEGVKRYTASLICYDNTNAVLDVLDISESLSESLGKPVRLHHKTSYIAYVLTSVNGTQLPKVHFMKTKITSMPLYIAAVSLVSFLQFAHTLFVINHVAELLDGGSNILNLEHSFFLLPSLAIVVICLLVTLLARIRKDVKVVLK